MEENIIVVDYTRHASQKTKAKLRENGGNCFYLLEEHQDVLVLGNKPGILVRKFAGGDCTH